MHRKIRQASIATAIMLFLAGCGQAAPDQSAGPANNKDDILSKISAEPVTLSFFTAGTTDEEFQFLYVEPTLKKYPNIQVNAVKQDKDHTLESMIAAGETPDLVMSAAGKLRDLVDLGLAYNMEPLIKQFNIDQSQFIPAALGMVKAYSGNNQLTAIPYTLGFRALYYNKDIFDKFGLPYPKAKMSWEDTVQLARKLTREDGGVQYYGLGIAGAPYLPMKLEMGLPFVDAKTKKAAVNTAQWKNIFDQTREFYQIPGNSEALTAPMNKFTKDKTLAMQIANNELRNMVGLNWDVTSVPTLKNDPDNGGEAIGQALAVTAQSKHKEAAFLLIANVLSDEVQTTLVKSGRPSALKASKYVDDFGKSMSNVTNQHLTQILQVNFKSPESTSEYDAYAQTALTKKFNETVTNGTDPNTALREANEDIDKYIQENQK